MHGDRCYYAGVPVWLAAGLKMRQVWAAEVDDGGGSLHGMVEIHWVKGGQARAGDDGARGAGQRVMLGRRGQQKPMPT